uniref:Resuscitation promoting factor n=1 Tax=Mycobacterium avium subsp. avium TaxID=44454 RepID=Q5UBV9_MYCAV|nr:resuscitation promoting factor [Mycobacterium avium subsp. avium]
MGSGSPLRVRRQLGHQHRQRLPRRCAVQREHLGRARRRRVRAVGRAGHPGATDRGRRAGAGHPGPRRVAGVRGAAVRPDPARRTRPGRSGRTRCQRRPAGPARGRAPAGPGAAGLLRPAGTSGRAGARRTAAGSRRPTARARRPAARAPGRRHTTRTAGGRTGPGRRLPRFRAGRHARPRLGSRLHPASVGSDSRPRRSGQRRARRPGAARTQRLTR